MGLLESINSFLLANKFFAIFFIVLSFALGFLSGVFYTKRKIKISNEFKFRCPHSPHKSIFIKTVNNKPVYNSCPLAKSVKFCNKLDAKCVLKDNLSLLS